MKIRPYEARDLEVLKQIHLNNELPANCMPDPRNPLFFIQQVLEHEGKPALAAFLKITAEPYLLVDRTIKDPEWRWVALKALNESIASKAWHQGLDQLSCWIPPSIEPAFKKRLEELGYLPSNWKSYTKELK